MGLALASPQAAGIVAGTAIRTAAALDKIGLEPLAIAGATFVYGLQYYRGVRSETGTAKDVAAAYAEWKRGMRELGSVGAPVHGLLDAIREDHRTMRMYARKYDRRESAAGRDDGGGEHDADLDAVSAAALAGDAVKKIGFQLMSAYRVMRWLRGRDMVLGAQFMSRAIRHAFGSDIHWDADFEPGIMVVHGFGLAISYAARVRTGSILFQNVTLGYGPGEQRGSGGGAPLVERNVHVGIGATLFGPIVVGEGTKIMSGCVLGKSVPARSLVLAPEPQIGERAPAISVTEASRDASA